MNEVFILFNGPPRSGKDVAKSFLNSYFSIFEPELTSITLTFSSVLQNAIPALYGIDKEEWDERYQSDYKDQPWEKLFGLSQRQALIKLSEEYLKVAHDEYVFSRIMNNIVQRYKDEHKEKMLFLMDTGFDGEFNSFVDLVGREKCIYVRVERAGKNFDNDSRNYISRHCLNGVESVYLSNDTSETDWFSHVIKNVVPLIERRMY